MKFQDSKNRTWDITISVFELEEVKKECGVLLTAIMDDEASLYRRLVSDYILLTEVIYVCCIDQVEAAGVSQKDFYQSVAGESLYNAAEAFFAALADFIPDPQIKAAILRVHKTSKEIRTEMAKEAVKKLDAIDVAGAVSNYIETSTDTPESPASIHVRSRTGNSRKRPKPAAATTGTGPPKSGQSS